MNKLLVAEVRRSECDQTKNMRVMTNFFSFSCDLGNFDGKIVISNIHESESEGVFASVNAVCKIH